jgi:hypothetical protein
MGQELAFYLLAMATAWFEFGDAYLSSLCLNMAHRYQDNGSFSMADDDLCVTIANIAQLVSFLEMSNQVAYQFVNPSFLQQVKAGMWQSAKHLLDSSLKLFPVFAKESCFLQQTSSIIELDRCINLGILRDTDSVIQRLGSYKGKEFTVERESIMAQYYLSCGSLEKVI